MLSCLAFVLDKAYWTFTNTFNFEDDLVCKYSSKLIHTRSLKLRPNKQKLLAWETFPIGPRQVYMTLSPTIDLEDDLGSWAQFQKLFQGTSLKLNQIINTWIFKELLNEPLKRLIRLKQPQMTLIMTFDIEGDLGSSILFQKWILEVKIIWKSGITLLSRHISSKVAFSSVSDMLIIC